MTLPNELPESLLTGRNSYVPPLREPSPIKRASRQFRKTAASHVERQKKAGLTTGVVPDSHMTLSQTHESVHERTVAARRDVERHRPRRAMVRIGFGYRSGVGWYTDPLRLSETKKESMRRGACTRKRMYVWKWEAVSAVHPDWWIEGVRPYACQYCPGYHIGHYYNVRSEMEDDCGS